MDNKEMSDLEKELLDSAAKLDSSKVGPEGLEQSAGGLCCGSDCRLSTSDCYLWTDDTCLNDCSLYSPA